MNNPIAVYRTTNADALRIWKEAEAAFGDWQARLDAFLAEHGFAGSETYYDGFSNRVVGVAHRGEEVPPGWRIERKHGYLTPRLSTKEGKALDAQLSELKRPDPRNQMPGMPRNYMGAGVYLTCGLEFYDGALYAIWSEEIPETLVDLTVWEPVKLSAYYAAVERAEEEAR
ncbi:hypothetical protein ACFY05_32510 [Microtetraspora fusca]|uniref:Uncharacterized protein n=1 Tax=Microtetraspora fusca TaxID=1997 RepID=A0ABW6VF99_MICFU